MKILIDLILTFKSFFVLFLGAILFFWHAFWEGKKSAENKENKENLNKAYEYKKRQDSYDATPLDVKREWLRKYTKNKVSDLAKRSSKK